MEPELVFVMLYSGVVSFNHHPGTRAQLTPEQALSVAWDYYTVYEQARGDLWAGLDQRSERPLP